MDDKGNQCCTVLKMCAQHFVSKNKSYSVKYQRKLEDILLINAI